jgi:flagellar protein FlaI
MPAIDYLKDIMAKAKKKSDEAEPKEELTVEKVMEKPLGVKEENIAEKKLGLIERFKEKAAEAEEREKTAAEKLLEVAEKELVDEYDNVKIYRIKDVPLLTYFIPVPKPTVGERNIINTLKEAATRLIAIEPYKIRDPEQRRAIYFQKVMDILNATPELNIPKHKFSFYADIVVKEMVGYGLLDDLIKDDNLEEIMVVGPKRPVYLFHRTHHMLSSNIEFYSDQEIQELIQRIAREVGRRVDISVPLLDARLPDGSRVNATIPPASVEGSTLTIRKFKEDPYSIIDLIDFGTMTAETAAFLWVAVEGIGTIPANMLLAGGTGCGKTTLLNVLTAFTPPTERIISIEDTSELRLPLEHWIRFEARPPGLEGTGEITLEMLIKNALRMRPDRVIVGEVRGEEAFTLFVAMNTGHAGSLGTIHANSVEETVVRVTGPPMNVPGVMLAGLDLIVMEQKLHDKKLGVIRRITQIGELAGVIEGKPEARIIFERNPLEDRLERTNIPSNYLRKVMDFTGLTETQVMNEVNERSLFLKELHAKGIKKIDEVSKRCWDFLQKRK